MPGMADTRAAGSSTHLWKGLPLSRVTEVLMFHDQTGPVPDSFRRLCACLQQEGIEYVVIGALALSAYGYRRATEDIDLCVRPEHLALFKSKLVGRLYDAVEGRSRRFRDPQTSVALDFLVSGEFAGRRSRNKEIRFPDPAESVLVDGICTVTLPRLVELKLVTWRFKDWADVVALIRANHLDESFAEQLHPLVRIAYLECFDQKVEEDRYETEGDS